MPIDVKKPAVTVPVNKFGDDLPMNRRNVENLAGTSIRTDSHELEGVNQSRPIVKKPIVRKSSSPAKTLNSNVQYTAISSKKEK